MDLLRAEYASDSSATTDGKPIDEPDGNASAPAAARNHAKEPDEAKHAAQQLSGGTHTHKSSTSTSVGNIYNHRICAACKTAKAHRIRVSPDHVLMLNRILPKRFSMPFLNR